MSRYYLVASYYDRYSKSYSNEVIIKEINGVKLSSLVKIDYFTSGISNFDIFNLLEKELGINNVNHLAIKYIKNNDTVPKYYKVIHTDKLFNDCVSSVCEKKVKIWDKTRRTNFVSSNNELFKYELEKLLKILENRDIEQLKTIYCYDPTRDDFSFFIDRYLNSSFDNEYDRNEQLELILLEFSRYKTFRRWFIGQDKKLDKVKVLDNNISKKGNSKSETSSIEDNIRNYEKEFREKNNMSVDYYNAMNFNQEHDEFLDEDEYKMMSGEMKIFRRK